MRSKAARRWTCLLPTSKTLGPEAAESMGEIDKTTYTHLTYLILQCMTPSLQGNLSPSVQPVPDDVEGDPHNPYRYEGNYSGWSSAKAAEAHRQFLRDKAEWEAQHSNR
jgi:hypothetical protein